MWTRPEHAVAIHPSQLVIGLYVWLDIPWDDHPFLYNKFRIASAKQIAEIRALGLDQVLYFPNKSTDTPPPRETAAEAAPTAAPTEPVAATVTEPAEAPVISERERIKEEKRAKLQRQKEAAARAERGWERTAKATREALIGLAQSPKQAGGQIETLARDVASTVAGNAEVLLHLLCDKQGEGPQFHAINVMTLSLLVGKAMGLNEIELTDLAMAALAHDVGKANIPGHLLKAKVRAKHEEEFYRQHPTYSVTLAKESGVFRAEALAAIADHHEHLDGSGWPSKKKNASLSAQIIGVVDRYERLCAPESPDKPGSVPREALAILFSREAAKFEPKLVSSMIRLLGVYPPGTIVQLNDGALGLVVSPGRDSLRPEVLIYTPEVSKEEAPLVDLGEEPDLKIDEAVKPASLPADVMGWLNPRQRLSYFFSTKNPS